MKQNILKVAIGVLIAFCLISIGTVLGQEKGEKEEQEAKEAKLKIKDLPPAVQQTVKEQSKGATIRGLSKEVEDGKTQYELELTVKGHSKDMIIGETGEVLEVEESVALSSLSAAVRAGVERNAGKAKIVKVETLTKGSAPVIYEVHIQSGTKKSEFQVDGEGNLIPKAKKG